MRLCFALDLHDDAALIAEYERWHRPENIWPEIPASIRAAGVRDMQIFRAGNRLCMLMEADADFSPARKARADATDLRVRAWEAMMAKFQQALPCAAAGEKWVPMQQIFSLQDALAAAHPPPRAQGDDRT